MTIAVILIVIICSFIIVHHLYKVKDKLDEQLKDLRYYQNHISQSLNRIEQSLYQIDDIVSDIEDKTEDKRIKFICKTNDGDVELYDTEVLNIKPTIDKNGNAILIINYYDIEFCVKSTMYCKKVEIANSKK